jgi:hypothetical protein
MRNAINTKKTVKTKVQMARFLVGSVIHGKTYEMTDKTHERQSFPLEHQVVSSAMYRHNNDKQDF